MDQTAYGGGKTPADQTSIAELKGVTKRFGAVLAASDLNLAISQGEFLSFLGPSGCGKTTALRMLAGFETPSEGQVLLDGEVVNHVDAHQRQVNMVFQHYALFPHMTVAQNIGYGLRQMRPRLDKATIAQKVGKALEVGLTRWSKSPTSNGHSLFFGRHGFLPRRNERGSQGYKPHQSE